MITPTHIILWLSMTSVFLLVMFVTAELRLRRMESRTVKLAKWLEPHDYGFAARVRGLLRDHVYDYDWLP